MLLYVLARLENGIRMRERYGRTLGGGIEFSDYSCTFLRGSIMLLPTSTAKAPAIVVPFAAQSQRA